MEAAKSANFEMSRYIDLKLYHQVERSHPFYEEMLQKILNEIDQYSSGGKSSYNLLELGSGTGIVTQELQKRNHLEIDALEFDDECCELLQMHLKKEKCNIICGDAVTYCKEGYYDIVASVFAHDHIHYDKRYDFAKNICANLKPGGIYIMGGEILPHWNDEKSHKQAVLDYHCYIVDKAIRDGNYKLAQIEINAIESGVDLVGDFKRYKEMFEEEMLSADFELIECEKMGPLDRDDIGGVYVFVFRKLDK